MCRNGLLICNLGYRADEENNTREKRGGNQVGDSESKLGNHHFGSLIVKV